MLAENIRDTNESVSGREHSSEQRTGESIRYRLGESIRDRFYKYD